MYYIVYLPPFCRVFIYIYKTRFIFTTFKSNRLQIVIMSSLIGVIILMLCGSFTSEFVRVKTKIVFVSIEITVIFQIYDVRF